MAVGDILAVEVGADGWYADITIAGLGTGGAYDLGLGANNTPAGAKVVLAVTSLGFDDAGNATTITRTVYGTKQVRQAYPNQASNQESVVNTSDVKVRVALSEPVYAKDKAGAGNSGVDITATIKAGFYTQGSANNAATLTATNSSTVAYPKVVGNWSWPDGTAVGASMTLRAVAFHASARQGRPVRCVKFTVTDAHAATVSATVTGQTVDGSIGDAVPVPEYIGVLSTAALTQGDALTARFQAYPWVGDSASVLDTSTGAAQPSPLYGPRTFVCDKAGTYGASVAVVDPVGGNDATGAAVAGPLNTSSPPAAFLTIAAALNALRTFNSTTYGRANKGNSTVYLRAGNHAWLGGSVTADSVTANLWCTITRYPTDSQASVVINAKAASGSYGLGYRVKISDVTWTAQSASGVAQGHNYLWLDNATLNTPTANQPPFYNNKVQYATRTTVVADALGFRPFSTNNSPWGIVRGSTLDGYGTNAAILVYTVLGNRKTSTNNVQLYTSDNISTTAPVTNNVVVAYNRLTNGGTSNPIVKAKAGTATETQGLAIIQNVLEQATSTTAATLQVAADSSTGSPVDNVLIWHNVTVGQRVNIAYDEVDTASGGGLIYRRGWSIKNNICDDWNIKSDTFAGSGYVADGAKVGNWAALFGCGMSGNLDVEATGIGAAGSFLFEFPGLHADQPPGTGSPPSCATRPITYPMFTSRQSFDGTNPGAGGGDYSLQTGSPAVGLPSDWLLAYDLAGTARWSGDAAGAYTVPQPPASGPTVVGGTLTIVGGTLTVVA